MENYEYGTGENTDTVTTKAWAGEENTNIKKEKKKRRKEKQNGYRLAVGNPQVFPLKKVAETYKKHYEAYPWFNDEIFIEEKSYEGVPIKEYQTFNGKEIIDADHYFGLDSCEIGSYFAEGLVNEFMDMLMPACMRDDCSQLGEPIALRMDEQGTYRNTYATFKKIEDNIWEYCGDCFRGENIKRGNDPRYV